MINRFKIGLFILIITYNLINPQTKVFAAAACGAPGPILQTTSIALDRVPSDTSTLDFNFTNIPQLPGYTYFINIENKVYSQNIAPTGGQLKLTVTNINTLSQGNHEGYLWYTTGGKNAVDCTGLTFTIVDSCTLVPSPNPAPAGQAVTLRVSRANPGQYGIHYWDADSRPGSGGYAGGNKIATMIIDGSGQGSAVIGPFTPDNIGSHALSLDGGLFHEKYCIVPFTVSNPSGPGGGGGPVVNPTPATAAGASCDNGKAGIKTAIGCIPVTPTDLFKGLLSYIFGFAGGIALLLMIVGAFQMVTSAGNPEAIKAGQERFTSAIIGLVFIVFAITLLEIIGVDILQIPGLGHN